MGLDHSYQESKDDRAVRLAVEAAVAAGSVHEVLRSFKDMTAGAEALGRGFGGSLPQLNQRECFATYCLRRPSGLDILRSVLEAGIGGRSVSESAEAACRCLMYDGGKLRNLGVPTLFHAAYLLQSPEAMRLAFELDGCRSELHSARPVERGSTVHHDFLQHVLTRLGWLDEDGFQRLRQCSEMLLEAGAPIAYHGEEAPALELFLDASDSVRSPGLLKELLGKYVEAGHVPLDRYTEPGPIRAWNGAPCRSRVPS
ncbi:hypothetical protein [Methylibium petroleiphilum]|nr:hypothetical protein [Methylibium petroleiphilum]